MLSTLILLPYYNRPVLVRNALQSIAKMNWPHWQLAFIDDSSTVPGEPIVREILSEHDSKITFYRIDTPAVEKLTYSGSLHGKIMNQAIKKSSCDLGVMLCDDDELYPGYLENLSDFFEKNRTVMSCYSKVVTYNPLIESSETATGLPYNPNRETGLINGCCRVDASMVGWRLACCKKQGVWFDERRSKDHDADFYHKLYVITGPMFPTTFIAQYKGLHPKQLGNLGPEQAWTNPKTVDKEPND